MTPVEYCIKEEFENFKNISFEEVSSDELRKQEVELSFRGKEIRIIRQHETQDQLRFNIFVSMLQSIKGLPELNCNMIVNFDDDVPNFNSKAPRLCFSRRKEHSNILIPDPHTINASKMAQFIKSIDFPFASKLPKAIFAGSDTGLYKDADNNQRFQFCYNNQDNPLGRFKITQFVEIDKFGTDTLSKYDKDRVLSPFIPVEEQLQCRYIININGNTTCWDRLLWVMSSNSLCLFLKPQVEQMSWYYHDLISRGLFYYIWEDTWEEEVRMFNENIKIAEKLTKAQQEAVQPFLKIENHLLYFREILLEYNEQFKKHGQD